MTLIPVYDNVALVFLQHISQNNNEMNTTIPHY